MTDIERAIRRGELPAVLILTGEEPLLVAQVVAALRDSIPPALRAFNLDVIEAKAGAAQGILNAARTLPMMGPRRLVLVQGAEALGAEGLDLVRAYLDAPVPEATLVLVFGKLDGRMKFTQAAKKKGFVAALEPPRQLVPWVKEEAQARKIRIAPDAASRLVEVVGKDLARLSSALDQLALFAGDRPIARDDVDELIAETRERTVFELANAVGGGDRAGALGAIARLFAQRESAVGVAMMLARHVRQLAIAREELAAGTPSRDLPRLLGVPPFAVDGLVAQARRWPAQAFPAALDALAQADRDLKGPVKAALGERIVLERLAERLLTLGTPPQGTTR